MMMMAVTKFMCVSEYWLTMIYLLQSETNKPGHAMITYKCAIKFF